MTAYAYTKTFQYILPSSDPTVIHRRDEKVQSALSEGECCGQTGRSCQSTGCSRNVR